MGTDPYAYNEALEREKKLRRLLTKHRSALTRARNSRDADKVLKAANAALADFDKHGYPDCWAVFKCAKEEAEGVIARRTRSGWTHPDYKGLL